MEVILKSDIKGVGQALDVVNVKNGYAQNFLFPKQLAVLASDKAKTLLEHDRARAADVYLKEKNSASALSERLKGASVTIAAKVAEGERLYGSVTNKDISAKLKEQGFEVERKQIDLSEPIKRLGMYTIGVKLHTDVEAKIKLWVISDESASVSS